jgi:hypothetical protein
MSLAHSHLSANELMTHHIMLHSAMGDSVVAFRHIIDFSEKHKDSDINLIYNKNIDPFMKHWIWPLNITLMPLEQTMHDFDNVSPFPYECDDQNIKDSFHSKENNAHDFRPFFIERDHERIEHNLKDFIPDESRFLHGFGRYVVIQPLSTIHQTYSTRCIDEELQTYEKFLINLIEHIHLHTSLSVAVVGIPDDGAKFPHLMAINSHPRYFNLIGHASIEDLCTIIGWSSAVLGLSSSVINIGNSIFEKPVISWRLKPSFGEEWGDLFDNFMEGDSKAIARPWEQDMNFYSDFLKKYEKPQKNL